MEGNGFPGLFVVIGGPDASGKETQAARMVEWLREEDKSDISGEAEKRIIEEMPGKYPAPEEVEKVEDSIQDGVWRLSFPTYGQTPGGRVVEAYLNGDLGDRDDISVDTIVDIYAADRKQFKELIREYLKDGGIIVCDRYREANLIHQLVGFEGDEWREKLEYIKSIDADLPDAERIFYLDISPEEAIERMSDKDKDIHELDDSYMEKSNRNGKKVAEHEAWSIVDAERSRHEVEEALREEIQMLL
jgi:dTMP kinase